MAVAGYTADVDAAGIARRLDQAQHVGGIVDALVSNGVDLPNDCTALRIDAPIDGVVMITVTHCATVCELQAIDAALKSLGR